MFVPSPIAARIRVNATSPETMLELSRILGAENLVDLSLGIAQR